jgi:hypothetical protein
MTCNRLAIGGVYLTHGDESILLSPRMEFGGQLTGLVLRDKGRTELPQ